MVKKNKDKSTEQLNMPIPADLYERCKIAAKKDGRSLANWVRFRLAKIVEAENCK